MSLMVKRKKIVNTENDYKMFVARCNPSEDFILPTLEELNQNGIAIIHNVNGRQCRYPSNVWSA